jgi:hypothetical protein
VRLFPFSKEVEKTAFYSGLLIFLPDNVSFVGDMFAETKKNDFLSENNRQWEDAYYNV